MNRDGYRADAATAGHEAAHAVIATMSGWVVGQVTIAPSQAYRRQNMDAYVTADPPEEAWAWPVPQSPTAELDYSAAGMAWDLNQGHGWREAWWASGGDRAEYRAWTFLRAVHRVRKMLRHREVAAAVHEVSRTVQSRRSGTIWGTTVDQITTRHLPKQAWPALVTSAALHREHRSGGHQLARSDDSGVRLHPKPDRVSVGSLSLALPAGPTRSSGPETGTA